MKHFYKIIIVSFLLLSSFATKAQSIDVTFQDPITLVTTTYTVPYVGVYAGRSEYYYNDGTNSIQISWYPAQYRWLIHGSFNGGFPFDYYNELNTSPNPPDFTNGNWINGDPSNPFTPIILYIIGSGTTNINTTLAHNPYNASITATPSGSTTPYTYLWNTGATTPTITSVITGTYNVTVTGADGNSINKEIAVTQPTIVPDANNILYVDKDATGSNNGSSWANALPELADALVWAKQNEDPSWATTPLQIWVAEGTYKPMYSPEDGANFGTNQGKANSFLMVENVHVYGGFAGTETQISQRDFSTNTTLLSGDQNQDDASSVFTDNSYHVVVASNSDNIILNGLTISGANSQSSIGTASITIATNNFLHSSGGGIYAVGSDFDLTYVKLVDNIVNYRGAGIFCSNAEINILNSLIADNTAGNNGRGFFVDNSTINMTNSTIANNANSAGNTDNTIALYNGSSFTGKNSIVFGSRVTYGGTFSFSNSYLENNTDTSNGNINTSTFTIGDVFVDESNGNYALKGTSPAINLGDNTFYTNAGGNLTADVDLAGNPRSYDSTIDIGAYEYALVFSSTCWNEIDGNNNRSYAIANNGTLWDLNTGIQVGTDSDWKSISTYGSHYLAVRNNGTLWVWGLNNYGQLGTGNTTFYSSPTQVGTDTNWKEISCGGDFSLATKNNGTLWSWGRGVDGRLGLGPDLSNRTSPTQVGTDTNWLAISAGSDHSLAIKNNGTLWSWGKNNVGQLGIGNSVAQNTPIQIGTDTNWQDIKTGGNFSLFLKNDNTLWSCGFNNFGQLGLGDLTNRNSPTQIGTDNNWAKINAGATHVLATKTNGTLWSWGRNNAGQLGLGNLTTETSPTQVGTDTDWFKLGTGTDHSFALKTDGTAFGFGNNTDSQLGVGDNINKEIPTQVICHTVLSSEDFNTTSILTIYPNPSKGIFTINSQEEVSIAVYDLLGKEILNQNLDLRNNTLNISNYSNGIYIARIISKNGSTKTFKLIKK